MAGDGRYLKPQMTQLTTGAVHHAIFAKAANAAVQTILDKGQPLTDVQIAQLKLVVIEKLTAAQRNGSLRFVGEAQ